MSRRVGKAVRAGVIAACTFASPFAVAAQEEEEAASSAGPLAGIDISGEVSVAYLTAIDSDADLLFGRVFDYQPEQFTLHQGTRILSRRLTEHGVPHEHQEFDDDHTEVAYRYDVSLPLISAAFGE